MTANALQQSQENDGNGQRAAARPAAVGQRQRSANTSSGGARAEPGNLGDIANGSPRAAQFKALAQLVQQSPQARQQRALTQQIDNSPRMTAQRKATGAMLGAAIQRLTADTGQAAQKPNQTGLPDQLKSGIESLSGMRMDHVKVHYNSPQPAQLNAHAYAQGSDIHVAPGQEKHVPHEAWHVVQQAQGRVAPTMQMKGGVAVNDDMSLEREADAMGAKAANLHTPDTGMVQRQSAVAGSVQPIQRLVAPGGAPPPNGQRGGTLNGYGVPIESHITTPIGGNDLVGTRPSPAINGWPYIRSVGASGTWVRFHLINESIGGLGNQNNLAPTSQATNKSSEWSKFEQDCQKVINKQHKAAHVSVDLAYPAPATRAAFGTVEANQHFYPNKITAECHRWNATASAWEKVGVTRDVDPFPLLPPADSAKTNLRHKVTNWVKNNLLPLGLARLATGLYKAIKNGSIIDKYVAQSNEDTAEMKLADALDTFIAVNAIERGEENLRLPMEARRQVLNGVYHL